MADAPLTFNMAANPVTYAPRPMKLTDLRRIETRYKCKCRECALDIDVGTFIYWGKNVEVAGKTHKTYILCASCFSNVPNRITPINSEYNLSDDAKQILFGEPPPPTDDKGVDYDLINQFLGELG